ncbi:uncharacterized protein J8A68_004252 [[Candida] subhashii]|uniref:Uncharacterized protein n=1 Tax=[Candida] subhashii TaxID=561895 RepID=A0A8J5QKB7_9ASCO|nr:uncharacterized protein J8A68_004252 [[Candida] subhashii]KAG7662242.1 hypothetical protein J8A68_004252 [[Candida] subhashii]
MATYVSMIDKEIKHFDEVLHSVPFNSDCSKLFLRVYDLSYDQLIQLNSQTNKFPIESHKLLKLGISLGNLIRTYEIEHAAFEHQVQQQLNFFQKQKKATHTRQKSRINPPELTTPHSIKNESSHSLGSEGAHSITSGSMHSFQIRFLKNLANILKSFDINDGQPSTTVIPTSFRQSNGSMNRKSTASMNSLPRTPPRPISTSTQLSSGSGISNVNYSPIKLTSGQLLIEKLEININLDSLFTYKIVFKLFLKIFEILKKSIIHSGNEKISLELTPTSTSSPNGTNESGGWESSSIFSSNSIHSQDSAMSTEEYLKMLHQVIKQISYGIMEPFILMIYHEIVEPEIHNGFSSLLDSL